MNQQLKKLYALAKRHGGLKADAASGQRGYELTFMIAYLRYKDRLIHSCFT